MGFRDAQRAANGSDAVMLSSDRGPWPYLTFPCHFESGGAFEAELLARLRADLTANRGRPTVVFEHYHLLPQVLTQVETYTYEKPPRTRLLHVLADAGNVRCVVSLHRSWSKDLPPRLAKQAPAAGRKAADGWKSGER